MTRPDKREQIMQAAEKLFASRRFHEVTLDDVARTARVGKGTIYTYFADKDELFFETATRGFDELCALLDRRVCDGAPFARQLLEACEAIVSFFTRRRQLLRMMQSEEGRMRWAAQPIRLRWAQRRKALVAAVAGILSRGVDEGLIRDDVPTEVWASFLLGLLRTRARDLTEFDPEHQRIELVVELFCNGACPADAIAGDAAAFVRSQES